MFFVFFSNEVPENYAVAYLQNYRHFTFGKGVLFKKNKLYFSICV